MPTSVTFVAFDGFQILDISGPWEVLATANAHAARPLYALALTSPAGPGPVPASGGLCLASTGRPQDAGDTDVVVVSGGPGTAAAVRDDELLGWLRRRAAAGATVASVCTGAFILAAAGLLAGRRATTHWQACDALARMHPDVAVRQDAIFVRDGRTWTSAGVTAGVDLALALVEDDHGTELALAVARHLVVPLSRPGGQSQYSARLATGLLGRDAVRDVARWIDANPAGDCSVPALARRASMSTRHFQRVFAARVGVPPAEYVERARLDNARRLLETTDATAAQIAAACGFGAAETFHRAFRRRFGTTPLLYRSQFSGASA